MRLVVAIVHFSPHQGVNCAELEKTFWVSATSGDRVEHIHATSTSTAWYICIYSRVQDPSEVTTTADQLVRRSLASIEAIETWSVQAVQVLI